MTAAFVFPGQGSQAVGMGKALAEAFAPARAVFDEVDAALGERLTATMWEGPADTLTLTGTNSTYTGKTTISAGTLALVPGRHHTSVLGEGCPGPNLGETQRSWLVRTKPAPVPELLLSAFNGVALDIHWNCDGNYAPGCGAGPTVWVDHLAVTEVDPKPPALKVEGSIPPAELGLAVTPPPSVLKGPHSRMASMVRRDWESTSPVG